MTQEPLPFDHRPDPVLGVALRQALEPEEGSHAAFVARLLARLDDPRGAGSWDRVLARWARVGVAAAVLFSLAAGYLVGRATNPVLLPSSGSSACRSAAPSAGSGR